MATASSSSHPLVTLAELPALAAQLAARIRSDGFRPEVLVYVEEGARLPAELLCRELGIPAVPVVARRRGHGLKKLAAPLIAWLPRGATNWLRRAEEKSRIHARGGRTVVWPGQQAWAGRRILVLDDAADTGATLQVVKADLVRLGAAPAAVRCAVLCATTESGRAQADFHVLDRNCVLPWSPDSPERGAALARMRNPGLRAP